MPINQSEQNFFDLLAQRETENPSKPLEEQSIEEFRKGGLILTEFAGEPADVLKKDCFIKARDGHQIPIRIFNSDIKTPGPVLIMFPGGGYVMDTFEANAVACSRIAKFSGQKIIFLRHIFKNYNKVGARFLGYYCWENAIIPCCSEALLLKATTRPK